MEMAKQNGMEAMFLSKIIWVLGEHPQHKMTVAELSTLLPDYVKPYLTAAGGLEAWLGKYLSIFSVSGGCVLLNLAAPLPAEPNQSAQFFELPQPTQITQPGFSSNLPAINMDATCGEIVQTDMTNDDKENDFATRSALHLRGLPFESSGADIRVFLGPFVAYLTGKSPIVTLRNRSGRPSGLARVQLDNPERVSKACAMLHRRTMSVPDKKEATGARTRYIEVYPATEMRFKATSFKPHVAEESKGIKPVSNEPVMNESDVLPGTIVQECCAYMDRSGKTRALLSTLGGELSPSSRAFMKKTGMGLKNILLQYSNLFALTGRKGQETVFYSPANMQQGLNVEPGPVIDLHSMLSSPKPREPEINAKMLDQATLLQSPKRNQTPKPMQSPVPLQSPNLMQTPQLQTPQLLDIMKGGFMDTPSNWGSPPQPCPAVDNDAKDKLSSMGPNTAPAYPFLGFPNFNANGAGTQHLQEFLQLSCGVPPPVVTPAGNSAPQSSRVTLCLHGLSATADVQDVFALLSAYGVVEYIVERSNAVHLVTESGPGDQSSQMASIEMVDRQGASIAKQVLDGLLVDSRKLKAVIREDNSKFSDNANDLKENTAPQTLTFSPGASSDNFLQALLSPMPMPAWLPPFAPGSTGGTYNVREQVPCN